MGDRGPSAVIIRLTMPENYPPSSPPPGPQPGYAAGSQAQGFIGSLMDFSFESFVTPKIIKLVYLLMLIGVALGALMFLVTSFLSGGIVGGVIGLVLTPIFLLLGAVLARVYVEIVMLSFKILETLQRIESKQGQR